MFNGIVFNEKIFLEVLCSLSAIVCFPHFHLQTIFFKTEKEQNIEDVIFCSLSDLNQQRSEEGPASLSLRTERMTTICQSSQCASEMLLSVKSHSVLYKFLGSTDRSTYASQ